MSRTFTPLRSLAQLGVVTLGLTLFASAAMAQDEAGPIEQILNNTLSSTTVVGLTTTTTVAAPITTTSNVFGGGSKGQQPPPTKKQIDPDRQRKRRDRRNQRVEVLLRGDAVAIQHAIATGGGENLTDLAALFNVPTEHRDTFARALRDHNEALLPLIEPHTIDSARAATFMLEVERVMARDEALAIYLHELMIWEVG